MDPVKPSKSSIFLRLPLEIRRMIYEFTLFSSQSPSAKSIYFSRLPVNWRDPPSPLLLVNGQIRDEVIELVQKYPITLRVTHQGPHFDGLAETCFIAQRRPRDYSKTSHLVIEIWPPHPQRPVDMIRTWRHLRQLRTELRNMAPLKQLSLFFKDNEMSTWTLHGKPLDTMICRCPMYSPFLGIGVDDVTTIMDLFTRVRVAKATFHMPRGLAPGERTESIRRFIQDANAMMMGRIPIHEDVYDDEDEEDARHRDWIEEDCEGRMGIRGGRIARAKLNALTRGGTINFLSHREWDYFVETWSIRSCLASLWKRRYVRDSLCDSDQRLFSVNLGGDESLENIR